MALGSRAEEQNTGGGAILRRADSLGGFGAAPAPAVPGGFGRRAVPIPSTTNGMPPLSVANDRAARADDGTELSFAPEQGVETSITASDTMPGDRLAHDLIGWLHGELRRGRDTQQEAVLCALGALAGYAAQ